MQANTKESMKRTKIIASTVTPGPKAVPEKHSAERILDAASELLSTEGYAAFSMRKVAAKVGLSQAAIYRHYKDKSELVGRIVDNGYALLRRSIEERSDPTGSPSTLIAEGFKAYVTFACEHSSLFKFVLLQDIGPSQVKVNVLSPGIAGQRRTFELLAGIISRGTAEGSFEACDPETTAQARRAHRPRSRHKRSRQEDPESRHGTPHRNHPARPARRKGACMRAEADIDIDIDTIKRSARSAVTTIALMALRS
jgi:AcrR family transcriptional regulator